VSILDRDAILQVIAALAARWPRAFIVHQAKRAPLKRGIDRDIAAAPSALRFYVHNVWCDTRLFDVESFGAPGALVLDPAAGLGRILQAARAAGYRAIGSDTVDRPGRYEGFPFSVCDFLKDSAVRSAWSVVCNSPFDHAQEPLRRLPAAHWLKRLPLETIYLLSPRPRMPPATYILAGGKPSNGAQDFIWVVSRKEMTATAPAMRWLHRNREASS
jgi:hypothetical protein